MKLMRAMLPEAMRALEAEERPGELLVVAEQG